ncbi:MAG: ThiF family adenylyltransferase, partial [Aeromonadaceae bacterium]|nr:ThiF family adenylyltransferase [Aeromonadaceae bacterium]
MNPVRAVVPLETVELTRYHRQINLKGWDLEGQERLKAATVLVVGLGGLGCTVAQQLVLAGVGQLILLDGDRVELSNLARQVLHEQSRIGHYKVNSAAEALARLNPHVQLTAIPEFADEVTLPDLLSGVDLVVDCCDNLA